MYSALTAGRRFVPLSSSSVSGSLEMEYFLAMALGSFARLSPPESFASSSSLNSSKLLSLALSSNSDGPSGLTLLLS